MKQTQEHEIRLNHAIEAFDLDITGVSALDIGASTGGFTDCLLQRGANYIYAVDVGYGQLADRIRSDPRVHVMERTNAREPFPLPASVNLIVADVSFISLKLVLPPSIKHLSAEGYILVLVKPQFEASRQELEKGGIIQNIQTQKQIVNRIRNFCIEENFEVLNEIPSPIQGQKGNQEYFLHIKSNT